MDTVPIFMLIASVPVVFPKIIGEFDDIVDWNTVKSLGDWTFLLFYMHENINSSVGLSAHVRFNVFHDLGKVTYVFT